MKRLIRKAEIMTVYTGYNFEDALSNFSVGKIQTRASWTGQTGDWRTSTNHTQNPFGIYLTKKIKIAAEYAGVFGVIYEINIDTDNDPITIEDDSFDWGGNLRGPGRDTAIKEYFSMFDNKEEGSKFAQEIYNSNIISGVGYDRYEGHWDDNGNYIYDEYELKPNDYIGVDDEGYYFINMAGIMQADFQTAAKILNKIPFEKQKRRRANQFVYNDDIPFSKITRFFLILPTGAYVFDNPQEIVDCYNKAREQSEKNSNKLEEFMDMNYRDKKTSEV